MVDGLLDLVSFATSVGLDEQPGVGTPTLAARANGSATSETEQNTLCVIVKLSPFTRAGGATLGVAFPREGQPGPALERDGSFEICPEWPTRRGVRRGGTQFVIKAAANSSKRPGTDSTSPPQRHWCELL